MLKIFGKQFVEPVEIASPPAPVALASRARTANLPRLLPGCGAVEPAEAHLQIPPLDLRFRRQNTDRIPCRSPKVLTALRKAIVKSMAQWRSDSFFTPPAWAPEPRLLATLTGPRLAPLQRTQTGKLRWPEELSKSWRKAVESASPEAMVTEETPEEHLAFLGRSVPGFAAHLAEAVGWDLPESEV